MRFRPFSILSIGVTVTFLGLAKAEAGCPDGQSSNSLGFCMPNIGGDVGRGANHITQEFKAQLGGVPLEGWINASHNTAISGTMPIPPDIRRDLTGYASQNSMNVVRYKIGDNGFANLAGVLEKGGFASAVTLIDVVVFNTEDDANNRSIWAHELTHVDQYASWGVHSFAIQYSRDYNSVESPAYAKGDGYEAWAANHLPGNDQTGNGQTSNMCWLFGQAAGVYQMDHQQPLGSQCTMDPGPQGHPASGIVKDQNGND